jgi:hypothetical protein
MFSIAGVSLRKGGYKVRYSDNVIYVKLLAKAGDTDITLVTLPEKMESKLAICQYLLTTDLAANPVYKATIDEAIEKYSGAKYTGVAAVKAPKVPKVKAVKPPKAEKAPVDPAAKMAAIKARAVKTVATTVTEPVVE